MTFNLSELSTKEYWLKFAKSDFWFGVDRLQMHGVDYSVLTLGAILTLTALALMVFVKSKSNPHTKDLIKRYARAALWVGILELFWFPLRFQNVTLFGTHFTAVLIFGIGFFWAIWILKFHLTQYNSHIEQWDKEALKKKYIEMPSK